MMASVGAKKRAKRDARRRAQANNDNGGRPPRDDVIRYPSKNGKLGRIDYRAMESQGQTMATVTEARMRQYGVTEAEAKSQMVGYALGRLRHHDKITKVQLEAGNRMHEDVSRYYALTGLPSPSPRAMDPNRVNGLGGEANQETITKASNKMMKLETVIGCVDQQGRPVRELLRRLVILDEDAENWTPSMVGHVKRGLTALVQHYQISGDGG
ncbi:hypothetical protein [Aurantimonas coralicida]|uniref:hypothetical protein n=1 Tax=Aurantimonas coralicida TaxID=182270 RepID=UPI001E59DCB9|nr:hypothetical protein [Aurantimonas coralicida]MCD1645184.1 hypothetical protein [Aurantimonas coralicida]